MTRADFFRTLAALPFVGWFVGRVEPDQVEHGDSYIGDIRVSANDGPHIYVQIDPLNPRDARHQRLASEAVREYRAKYTARIRRVD